MFYTVYKITNQINGKIYVGCHKTVDLNDGYMGSGKYLKRSQEKNGIENFTKEILFVYDNPDEMYAKEAEIVNEDFLAEENTYNLMLGGYGGWDTYNEIKNSMTYEERRAILLKGSESKSRTIKAHFESGHYDEFRNQTSERLSQLHKEGKLKYDNMKGKSHTEETKRKIGEKNSKSQSGKRNSQYGKRWIHSFEEKRSTRINKNDPLPEGWLEGRKIKF